jgi:uncharacterized membrane protein YphA (DoxX/SURF4 family)
MKFGRYVYGLAAIAFGVIGLKWDDFAAVWQPFPDDVPARDLIAYGVAGAFLLAGLALQWRRTAAIGAIVCAALYAMFALFWGLRIAARPDLFATWSGTAEEIALVMGGLVALAMLQPHGKTWPGKLILIGRWAFALCLLAFGAAHFTSLDETAALVPAWLPPSPQTWAAITGAAHIAAGLALLTGVLPLLAARLLTLMFVGFGALVWAPLLMHALTDHTMWCGNAINLALVGAAWVIGDAIAERRAEHH